MTKNKKIFINVTANMIAFSTTALVSFILTPFLINTLGKEAYSFYPIANNIITYVAILVGALNTMASRFISIRIIENDYDGANRYFSSVFIFNIILSAVFALPLVFFVIYIDRILNIPVNLVASVQMLFYFIFVSMIINIVSSIYNVSTFAKNRIELNSIKDVIVSILRVILLVVFYRFLTPDISYIGVVTLIIMIITFVIQKIYAMRLTPELKVSFKKFDKEKLLEVSKASIWNSINSLGNMLLVGISIVLANILYGSLEAGTYSIVQTVPILLNGLISALTAAFYPIFMNEYVKNNSDEVVESLKTSQKIVGLMSSSLIAVFIGISIQFFKLWTPGEDANTLFILSSIAIIPHIIIGAMWSLNNLIVVINKVKIPAIMTLTFGVLNLLISYGVYLIFSPGIISLAIISTCLQILWAGLFYPLYCSKQLKISKFTFFPTIFKSLIMVAVISSGIRFFLNRMNIDDWFSFFIWAIGLGIITIICGLLFIVGPKSIKVIIAMIKNKIKRGSNK